MSEYEYVAPEDGIYEVELWGAGGGSGGDGTPGLPGGYATGTLRLKAGEVLKITVGKGGMSGGESGRGSSSTVRRGTDGFVHIERINEDPS